MVHREDLCLAGVVACWLASAVLFARREPREPKPLTHEDLMQYHETSWTSTRGTETIHTDRLKLDDGSWETTEAWDERHNAAVAAAQASWPKV